jgi:FRG domain
LKAFKVIRKEVVVKMIEGDWQEFELWLGGLRAELGNMPASPLLFRGQGDSEWSLETTLERNGQENMSFGDFYRLITARIGPAVSTFTGESVPEYDPNLWDFGNRELLFPSPAGFPSHQLYRYMVYLRHHGFPSPLLDWSHSPHVAAFFAFRDDRRGKRRSIYAYCERPTGVKGGAVGEPTICRLGPYVRGHRRHFLQQSNYTICGSMDTQDQWRFHSHEKVFDQGRPGQDFLWKFDIPSEERVKVLRLLNDYNLNAFSLFDSEETLLETCGSGSRSFESGTREFRVLHADRLAGRSRH